MYRLNLDPVAEEQVNAVPEGALRPLAELFTLLEADATLTTTSATTYGRQHSSSDAHPAEHPPGTSH